MGSRRTTKIIKINTPGLIKQYSRKFQKDLIQGENKLKNAKK